jgi:phosphoglycolate phosphatase-like HAD superfamily hydrolase
VSPKRPTIYLFDIDGTILSTGGAGTRAFIRAFGQVTGHPEACQGFSFAGMTDLSIIRQSLSAIGRPMEQALVDDILETYLEALRDEIARTERYRIMPGVREVVSALRERPHVAVGLGTGNLRRGAEVKLTRGELWHLFDFGGFGCDFEDRIELLKRGAERGAQQLGLERTDCRVVVIGDTTRDIVAARGIGAECLAVATGSISAETLRAAGADLVVPDLTADGALEMLAG